MHTTRVIMKTGKENWEHMYWVCIIIQGKQKDPGSKCNVE